MKFGCKFVSNIVPICFASMFRYINRLYDIEARSHGCLTTHLLSIERADWPKLHDVFKARDAKA